MSDRPSSRILDPWHDSININRKPERHMFYKGTNFFSQIVSHIDKNVFNPFVHKHNGERHAKGFLYWEELVSMLFCQISGNTLLGQVKFSIVFEV